jgi:hypothetical protein
MHARNDDFSCQGVQSTVRSSEGMTHSMKRLMGLLVALGAVLSMGVAIVGLAAPAQAATRTSVVQPQIRFVPCNSTPEPIIITGQTSGPHCFGGTVGTIITLFFAQIITPGGYFGSVNYSDGQTHKVLFRPGEFIDLGTSRLIQSVSISPPF